MKKILKFILCLILMFTSIIYIYYHYKDVEVKDMDNNILENEESDVVTPLIDSYNNQDIIAKLIIPGVIETPVAQSTDNDYYTSHDLYRDVNDQGAIYLDYRNNLEDLKLLIYSNNKNKKISIFENLLKYQDEDFYIKHPKMYLYTKTKMLTYSIFSIYEENNDFSYTNINSFNGTSYYQHLINLKTKSIYENDTYLSDNSRILILDTDLSDEENPFKNFIVIGALE